MQPKGWEGRSHYNFCCSCVTSPQLRAKWQVPQLPADTHVSLAANGSRVGKTLHKYSLLISCAHFPVTRNGTCSHSGTYASSGSVDILEIVGSGRAQASRSPR